MGRGAGVRRSARVGELLRQKPVQADDRDEVNEEGGHAGT